MENSLEQILAQEERTGLNKSTRILLYTTMAIFLVVLGLFFGKSQSNSNSIAFPAGFDPSSLMGNLPAAGIQGIESLDSGSTSAPSSTTGTVTSFSKGELVIDQLDGTSKTLKISENSIVRESNVTDSKSLLKDSIVTINLDKDGNVKTVTILK
jgi:hypothetical protein